MQSKASRFCALNLKVGEYVEVRSQEEILSTLDEFGRLDNLPFMPEMIHSCGKKFRVFKRADKTCDNIIGWSIRRMKDSVHLEGVRCDGEAHGGCQAGCLIFWKEAWLKRAENDETSAESARPTGAVSAGRSGECTESRVLSATQKTSPEGETLYSCQATELRNYTSHMRVWDLRQYVRDVRSGNLTENLGSDRRAHRALELALALVRVFRAMLITFFNQAQDRRHGHRYPFAAGELDKTPTVTLDLQAGEVVQVLSKKEIMATLDRQSRNRGLAFGAEMLAYCGGIYRVLRRVHRIVDEKTGKMMDMKYPCIILEGVACRADYHRLCPKAIFHYWREAWLKRVESIPALLTTAQTPETRKGCEGGIEEEDDEPLRRLQNG